MSNSQNMFDSEFYPTDHKILDQIDIDVVGKIVFEPQAGKGNIVDYVKSKGALRVIGCEKHPELREILKAKCQIIGTDSFLISSDQISHVHLIIMNPPFSNADKHILHAWNIAPEGCEIIALCNSNTIDNDYSSTRKELLSVIRNYGDASQDLGSAFSGAERKTDVSVKVVRLFKPALTSDFDYEGFHFDLEPDINQDTGIIKYDYLQSIVNTYVASVKCFDRFRTVAEEMNTYTKGIGFGSGFSFKIGYGNDGVATKDDFSRELQKHCWKQIFNKLNMNKYVTKGVMQDINKFIELRQNYPFTLKNIYKMLEIIVGTRSGTMNRAIVEAVDNFTKHTHENRYSIEGWKTNSGHMLNKKFIVESACDTRWSSGLKVSGGWSYDRLNDLQKALCYLMGINYDEIKMPEGYLTAGTWYEWGFFEFKVFKKGSGHFKFKDLKAWETINRQYAEIKGEVLPEKI